MSKAKIWRTGQPRATSNESSRLDRHEVGRGGEASIEHEELGPLARGLPRAR